MESEKMDIFKDKEILEYYGIYEKRELTQKEEKKYQKLKKEIEKLIEEPIERMSLMGENAWGKPKSKDEEPEEDIIFIALDKRFKDLDREHELLTKYSEENNIGFVITSLCRYEKRKKILTEREYLIENYGIKIYDSEKEPSINESIAETQYAFASKQLKQFRRYMGYNLPLMESLVRLYILKLGAPVNKYESNFQV